MPTRSKQMAMGRWILSSVLRTRLMRCESVELQLGRISRDKKSWYGLVAKRSVIVWDGAVLSLTAQRMLVVEVSDIVLSMRLD